MLRRGVLRGWWLLLASVLLWPAPSQAVRLDPVATGLQSPLYITHSRDGSGRLFIVEQPGRVRLLKPGANTSTVFLNITGRVLFSGERGLLGLAFHPQFATNRRFFVNYTRTPDGATVIAEYQGPPAGVDVADPNTERILLVVAQPFDNHNGGMIEFGHDGFLYIAFGDGGSGNDPGNHAQNPNDLLGKILRIDVNGTQPYAIPPDNPFAGGGGRPEIYALGFRNPFRFSFDRVTGTLLAGDVGQGAREEIDVVTLASFGEDEAGEVDVVDLTGAVYRLAPDAPTPPPPDGDTNADVVVYRAGTAEWFIRRSTDGGLTRIDWGCGSCGDSPVAADYDGDGFSDVAVFRTTTGEWFIQRSSDSALVHVNWGCVSCGDQPVAADYDGDGRAEVAVYRSSTGQWFILRSSDGGVSQVNFRFPPTTIATAGPTSPSIARARGSGSSCGPPMAVSPSSTGAACRAGTGRCPPTTTATAGPTSPSTARAPGSGSSSAPPTAASPR